MARGSSITRFAGLLSRRGLPGVALLTGALACSPDLPLPIKRSGAPPGSADGGVSLAIEPPSPIDAAPPILRLRLAFDKAPPVDPARVYLFKDELGPSHLRQIERDELSKALSKRIVPALVWKDEAASPEQVVVIAPTAPLELGATYTVASGEPPFAAELRVVEDDPAPTLKRLWPPVESGITAALGVWCGEDALTPFDRALRLEPGGPPGFLRPGAVAGAGLRCARFEAESGATDELGDGLVGPPALELEGGLVRLDPRPFLSEASPSPTEPLACDEGEIQFGPGCARVFDDRLLGRAPEAPLLWVVAAPELGLDHVFATDGADPFVIAPLAPLASLSLDVTVIDAAGAPARSSVSVTTLEPMAHIILNEVFANPLGEEPEQEWVEIVNDGAVAADLGGLILADVGGKTALPSIELAPGAIAMIVNERYNESDDELDPVPPPGAVLIRVPKLGKDGLSNGGEPIKLLDADGRLLSRAPATPKPKPGWSVARVSPGAPDGLASSFKLSGPSPGEPNP